MCSKFVLINKRGEPESHALILPSKTKFFMGSKLAVEGGNVYPYLNPIKTQNQEKQCSKSSSLLHLQIMLQKKKEEINCFTCFTNIN